jgi:signal transduction histidine kinase
VFSGVTLAFVMTLAFFDVRRITAPIRRLTAASERLAAGSFDEPVTIAGAGELGELARAFESMRVRLRDSMERERNLAVLEERERIAGEMHDGLGQVLGYVIMKSLAVAELMDGGHIAEARTQIDQLEAAAREAYADVRENILALRTTLAPGRTLLSALRDYAAGFERQSGIAVELIAPSEDEDGWMEPTAEVQLLRIVQEALTNVRKHAEARRVTVRLSLESDRVQAEVVDDGRGFDPRQPTSTGSPHFGLEMMRERATAVGGTFAIAPDVGGGTRVAVTVPRCQRGGADAAVADTPRR